MARLNWAAVGERYFETGVDRGVLYTELDSAVVWTGLVSVTESPTGGEPRPYYLDGIKYLNLATAEEFEATLNAFSYPAEFAACDGKSQIQNGLFATQQPRRAFNLSYRTMVGNDTGGKTYGYKIHLVYNALAGPSERTNTTLGDETEPNTYSWQITTLPPSLTGMKPTAHFVIDSRYTPRGLLSTIEDILYGTNENSARLPMVSELITLFKSMGPITRRNLCINPQPTTTAGWTANGLSLIVAPWDVARMAAQGISDGVTNFVITSATGGGGLTGEAFTVSGSLQCPLGSYYKTSVYDRTNAIYYDDGLYTLSDGTQTVIAQTAMLTADSSDLELSVQIAADEVGTVSPSGVTAYLGDVLIEKTELLQAYFDGSFDNDLVYFYSWEGEPNASASVINSWA